MKYKVGDMIILKKYYDETAKYFIELPILKEEQHEAYNAIVNSTPVKILSVDKDLIFPYLICLPGKYNDENRRVGDKDINREIDLGNMVIIKGIITNWKKRLQ